MLRVAKEVFHCGLYELVDRITLSELYLWSEHFLLEAEYSRYATSKATAKAKRKKKGKSVMGGR